MDIKAFLIDMDGVLYVGERLILDESRWIGHGSLAFC